MLAFWHSKKEINKNETKPATERQITNCDAFFRCVPNCIFATSLAFFYLS